MLTLSTSTLCSSPRSTGRTSSSAGMSPPNALSQRQLSADTDHTPLGIQGLLRVALASRSNPIEAGSAWRHQSFHASCTPARSQRTAADFLASPSSRHAPPERATCDKKAAAPCGLWTSSTHPRPAVSRAPLITTVRVCLIGSVVSNPALIIHTPVRECSNRCDFDSASALELQGRFTEAPRRDQ